MNIFYVFLYVVKLIKRDYNKKTADWFLQIASFFFQIITKDLRNKLDKFSTNFCFNFRIFLKNLKLNTNERLNSNIDNNN